MTLKEKLDAIKAQAKTRIRPEAQVIMERAIDDVRASGILRGVPRVGDRAPDFTLPDAQDRPVSLSGLLARSPVVLSFFRGRW